MEKTKNEELYDKAVKAVLALFGDMDVSKEKAVENLKSLKEEIDILIESIHL